ncbi:hypothetical protein [Pseudobacteriovorax antillogorgiicola]|uniref:Uncharacterized protein n=1 Tax=Pseudobacteriovorax antillogorgiicola TaxID=1513793 RepID=A0A1Y6CEC3_9BACT|nr:hypothetical protein [Pseudobacteriovorax antillogorgiicola]TCS51759.1 hypothetical protein EDD56_110144 [Pseudobacteriovorax antillogorgiicola]SMF49755.1 hypothetical protein SAMN06296036_115113 [Pseudobacteriovorax antillogorgiicola]
MLGSFLLTLALQGEVVSFQCRAAREYITTYRYLKDHKEFSLNDEQVERIAFEVTKGCNGAAYRFTEAVNTLVKAQLDTASAIRTGRDLAQRNDGAAETFLTVFKASYASDVLDLPLIDALAKAKQLSLNLNSIPPWLEEDFRDLAFTCVEVLQLPRPKCANFVTKLVYAAARLQNDQGDHLDKGVAKAFHEGLDFLTQKDAGPKLARFDALGILEEILLVSPYALAEFVDLYRFAVDKKDRPLPRGDAVEFAKGISKLVVQRSKVRNAKPGSEPVEEPQLPEASEARQ